ncbi:hypothetical protein ONS95_000705 [Cadophora gregata]|uniref:uncharacterized protein n=1 Tax=Cadophora gregata TaxID=51156 RepID=UPI0026DAD861|nr:uncharacterized protein ONS95_000705 [Cadophora gregata]KAK0128752.1 hypothetical protein ONS95_000705 [Cadophora gregata]
MSLRLFSPHRPLHLPSTQPSHTHSHSHLFNLRLRSPLQPIRHSSSSSSSTTSNTTTHPRLTRILTRLPRFLHPYTTALRTAPISHLTSFLILHEITAIVPLLGLATSFHYTNWLPERWVQGKWVNEGVERFGRYFGRKGWFGFTSATAASASSTPGPESGNSLSTVGGNPGTGVGMDSTVATASSAAETEVQVEEYVQGKWHAGQAGTRILVEVATAYAVTKVLLPVRILGSVWAAPWFARVVLGRFGRLVGRVRGRGGSGNGVGGVSRRVGPNGGGNGMSGAAGTGATGGGVGVGAGKGTGS